MTQRPIAVALRPGLLAFVIALALSLALTITACGSDAETPAPEPTRSPQDVLRESAAAVGALDSVTFKLSHEVGSIPMMAGVVATEIEGSIDLPDRYTIHVKGEAALFRAYIEISMVRDAGVTYMTDPLTGRWREVPIRELPFNLVGAGASLASIMLAIQDPVIRDDEAAKSIEGTVYITGAVLSENLSGLIPNAGLGYRVNIRVWIREADGLLTQSRIQGRVVDSDSLATSRVLTLSGFNEPVVIETP